MMNKLTAFSLLISVAGLAACSNAAGPHTACTEITPNSCAVAPTCAPVEGTRLDVNGEGGLCLNDNLKPHPVACVSVDTVCEDTVTYAAPSGHPLACTRFETTCVPAGYVPCSADLLGAAEPASCK